jgi:heme-degrading monooxygenase HmoA
MAEAVYTLGVWRVKADQEADFIAAWKHLGEVFNRLPQPPGHSGYLIQSLTDQALFYSFGQWDSLQAIQAMREDAGAQAEIRRLRELCTEATPGSFRLVAQV